MSEEPGARIRVTESGPLMVKGPFTVLDADGTPYTSLRKTVFLCRCGASRRKPFCDGSHKLAGFVATERAQPAEPTEPVSPAA